MKVTRMRWKILVTTRTSFMDGTKSRTFRLPFKSNVQSVIPEGQEIVYTRLYGAMTPAKCKSLCFMKVCTKQIGRRGRRWYIFYLIKKSLACKTKCNWRPTPSKASIKRGKLTAKLGSRFSYNITLNSPSSDLL